MRLPPARIYSSLQPPRNQPRAPRCRRYLSSPSIFVSLLHPSSIILFWFSSHVHKKLRISSHVTRSIRFLVPPLLFFSYHLFLYMKLIFITALPSGWDPIRQLPPGEPMDQHGWHSKGSTREDFMMYYNSRY